MEPTFYGIIRGNTSPRATANRRGLTHRSCVPMSSSSVPRTSGIYKITCLPTGKFYIGSSANMGERCAEHRRLLRLGKHQNRYLQNAWNKYGQSAFIFEVVELCASNILLEREQHWIDAEQPFGGKGFNIAVIAAKPPVRHGQSEETKAKISRSRMGIRPNAETRTKLSVAKRGKLRKPHSDETRAKIAEAIRGQTRSPELRAKISAKLKGRLPTFKGRSHSAESRAKMGSAKSKAYIATDPSGNEYEVFGLTSFCHEHGLHPGHMASIACGKRRSHRGWTCRKVNG